MFTGLIEATGRVAEVDLTRLRVETSLTPELRPGDSIAVNGVCLTVTDTAAETFGVDVSPETRRVTSLGSLAPGLFVNLERPMRADSRLGGHFVLGHVDAVGHIVGLGPDADAYWLEIDVPPAMAPLLISKGSVAVDGVSLTVAKLTGARFGVQLVPFTWDHTAFRYLHVGDAVNIEADVLGKYVQRLLDRQGAATTP
jgi:riboflavin synthase